MSERVEGRIIQIRSPHAGPLAADAQQAAIDRVRESVRESIRLSQERAELARERWGAGDNRAQMTRLCLAFPSLRGAEGVDPWDPLEFLHWLCTSGAVTAGSDCAGRFVLQVWNSAEDWLAVARELGYVPRRKPRERRPFPAPFNVAEAFGRWDEVHRAAFLAWCEAPFHP